ncbi:MAG: universal stress protein [Bacteroidales bacterium]|nr:universal stress protein [Bacteroidales bacterium]
MKEKLLNLGTLTQMRAQLLSAMLERHGIESIMVHANKIEGAVGGVDVLVREEDFLEASGILDDFKSAFGTKKQMAVEYMRLARRILVPVDYSLHAENAAFYALNIAAAMKSDIMLLNVYLDPNLNPFSHLETFTFAANLEQITQEVEEQTEKWLKAMAQKLKDKIKEKGIKGVNVFYDLAKDNIVSGILEYTREYKPGLVVMGPRGNKLEGLWTFGSITAKVIEKLNVPIIAVPKGFDAITRPAPKRIVYATGFDETDFWSLSRLATFAHPFDAQIYCLHVSETIEKQEEANMRKMRKFIAENLGLANIECGLLECLDLQLCLEDFVKEKEIDIVAMTTHHRNLFTQLYRPSQTRKMLFHTDVPLLVFHAGPYVK